MRELESVGRWDATAQALADAYERRDDADFGRALERLGELAGGAPDRKWVELGTRIESALQPLRVDPQLAKLAGRDVPDARLRLDHVLTLTSEAAHRTLDLIEKSAPMLESMSAQAAALLAQSEEEPLCGECAGQWQAGRARTSVFVRALGTDALAVRENLGEMLMAQSYQDLSGQLIRRVIDVVMQLQSELAQVACGAPLGVCGGAAGGVGTDVVRGEGPAVPGISAALNAQLDVDELLSATVPGGEANAR